MSENELHKITSAKRVLDKISSSFCTVKWKHATLNLGSGAVKSCCHLPFRKFSPDNSKNSFQLHDTVLDREERALMLDGQRPKDCSYCWWIEDQGHFSDRLIWSSRSWMFPYSEVIGKKATNKAEAPSWLELNFSNVCNLKCSYCSPIFSTKWLQEIKENGPYPTTPQHNDMSYLQGVELDEKFDNTNLMNQFWPWFEDIYPDLRLLKITGGEPFLSPHTLKILHWVLQNPNPQLNVSINSNLSIPEQTWNQFIDLTQKIHTQKSAEKLYLYPSIDCFGPRAEYIRYGLDFRLFRAHVEDYLTRTNGHVFFLCTLNNLALGGLEELWMYLLELKKKFGARGRRVSITTEVLMSPNWQNINILPESFQKYIQQTIDFAQKHKGESLEQFSSFEVQGLVRALDMMKVPNQQLISSRKNFYHFFTEHDRRRGTNLRHTFPEMIDFFDECGRLDALA